MKSFRKWIWIVITILFNTPVHEGVNQNWPLQSFSTTVYPPTKYPPVDTGIIEGETSGRRDQWYHRPLDPFFTVTTARPPEKIIAKNLSSVPVTDVASEHQNSLREIQFRNPTMTPATKLDPFDNVDRRRQPIKLDSGFLNTRVLTQIPPASPATRKESPLNPSGRFDAKRSFSFFPTLLNQPHDSGIDKQTIWPETATKPIIKTTSAIPPLGDPLDSKDPPIVLTIIFNDTTIGTTFGLTEDHTDAHLSMMIIDSPTAPTTSARPSVKVTPSRISKMEAGSGTSETDVGLVNVTTNKVGSIAIEMTTTSSSTIRENITVEPTTSRNETLELSENLKTGSTIDKVGSSVIEFSTSKSTTPTTMRTNFTAESSSTSASNDSTAKPPDNTTHSYVEISTATTIIQSSEKSSTISPIHSSTSTTEKTFPSTSTTKKSTTIQPSQPKRRLPNFLLNPRQTIRPRPTTVSTTPRSIISEMPSSFDEQTWIRPSTERPKEDKYVPTLIPPLPTMPTRRQHVITVPPIDDAGFIVEIDDEEYEESSFGLRPTSLGANEDRLIPEGANEAIMVSCTIGGCAVVFFAIIMVFCMLRNRRTVYRTPESSTSTSVASSASPFHSAKVG